MEFKSRKLNIMAVLVVIILSLPMLSQSKTVDPAVRSPEVKEEWLTCKVDKECETIVISCTDCREFHSINSRFKANFESYKTSACKQILKDGGGKALCYDDKRDSAPKSFCRNDECALDPNWAAPEIMF